MADLSPAYEVRDDAALDPSWCARCTLPARIAERTAPGSIDCGNVTLSREQAHDEEPPGAAQQAMLACVREALAADKPFTALRIGPGKDSTIGTAWVRDAEGRLHVYDYDSDVHGGGSEPGECKHGGGPSIRRAECHAPAATDAKTIIACGKRTPAMLVCSRRLPN